MRLRGAAVYRRIGSFHYAAIDLVQPHFAGCYEVLATC
jgi:hypothetical protein